MTSETAPATNTADLIARANEVAEAIGTSNLVALRQQCMAVALRHADGGINAEQRDDNVRALGRRLIIHALTGEYPDA